MEKTNNVTSKWIYIAAVILSYITINQGGFFAGGIISTGLLVSLFLLTKKTELGVFDIAFFVFSVWYLFCSVLPGFDIRYIAKGLIPLLCLMFKKLIPKDTREVKKLLEKVIKVSFVIAVAAIIICVYSSVRYGELLRLKFPFQYANASGIFFGVMFILSRYSDFSKLKKWQYVFFLGLVLTQSVGSIGMTVIAEICLSKNFKRTLVILGILVVGAVCLKDRVYQSIGTFIERFLQMHDGIMCLLDHPVTGIGAGRWELFKNVYQTGFYQAKEIHSSIVEIATASGFVGIVLFILSVLAALKVFRFENKVYLAGALMLVGHSCLDFTLSFPALGFIAILLLACGEDSSEKTVTLNKTVSLSGVCVLVVTFLVLSVGMYQMNRLYGIYLSKNLPASIEYYEANPLSRQSVRSKENYAKSLYITGDKVGCEKQLEKFDVLSTDMIALKKNCTNDWRTAFEYLEIQPYNKDLYITVYYNCKDEALQGETKEMLDEKIESMSLLGKILFKFKGEKVL